MPPIDAPRFKSSSFGHAFRLMSALSATSSFVNTWLSAQIGGSLHGQEELIEISLFKQSITIHRVPMDLDFALFTPVPESGLRHAQPDAQLP